MPSSWQARWTRRAISPRLATRIFLNMGHLAAHRPCAGARQCDLLRLACGKNTSVRNQDFSEHKRRPALFDHEQRLAIFHGLAVLAEDARTGARLVGLDLVQDLHGLDDADSVAFLDLAADLDEGLGTRAGRA